jgi:hypothetical protein
MDKITALCKTRGFVFPGSEIYGGLANAWDYGPLGVELKNNIKNAWWRKFVQESPYNVGMDAAILMNPRTWEVSGHLANFTDPLTDCRRCKARFRADKLVGEWYIAQGEEVNVDGWDNVRALVNRMSPDTRNPNSCDGNLLTKPAAKGAAITPPTMSADNQAIFKASQPIEMTKPIVAANATTVSLVSTEPTTLRGSTFSLASSVVVAIGPQPPPPVASKNPAIKPSPPRNRLLLGRLVRRARRD